MDKTHISAMTNPFESEDRGMGHIVLSGKSGSGKTELIKQFVGSFLQSGKRVLWFATQDEETLMKRWNGKVVEHENEIGETLLSSHKFIVLKTTQVDFVELKDLLMQSEHEWVIVQDDLDEVSINYEQNEYITRKLDFLYFISEFGRVFNLYSLVSSQDLRYMSRAFPSEKIMLNSQNLIFLHQSEESLAHAKQKDWLRTEHVEKLKALPEYEAFFVQR